jgi:hypothetical protein
MAAPVGANDANIGAQVPPKLYWIDQFCDEAAGGNFEKIHVLEARRWAKRTYERLSSDTDTDFARIFNLIFKTPKTDATLYPRPKYWQQTHGNNIDEWRTSYQHVFHVLYDFAHNWARTDNRQEAVVRIYAGPRGLSRWQAFPAGGDGNGHTHFDPINCLVTTRSHRYNEDTIQAFVSKFSTPTPIDAHGHPLRCTIDIAPKVWAVPSPNQVKNPHDPISVTSLSSLDPALLLPGNNPKNEPVTIGHLANNLVTRVLLHEFMHVHGYLLDDLHVYPGREVNGTSGWPFCMRRFKGEAAVCAEPVAMLGLWAALADMRPAGKAWGGFTVDRAWDTIPGGRDDDGMVMKWNPSWVGAGRSALKGELRFYEDITK